jgi:DNA mismatch endonuclease, patch repair protein
MTALNQTVSAQMRRMPRRDTTPELLIRRELHRRGLRFLVHDKRLPGCPDLAFGRAQLAVFVDGCFWHVCPEHATWPKNNDEWWRRKLENNITRDRRNDVRLSALGWVAIHIWEHVSPAEAASLVENTWRQRTGRSSLHRNGDVMWDREVQAVPGRTTRG